MKDIPYQTWTAGTWSIEGACPRVLMTSLQQGYVILIITHCITYGGANVDDRYSYLKGFQKTTPQMLMTS